MTTPIQSTTSLSARCLLPARTGRPRTGGGRVLSQVHARLLARALATPGRLVDLLRPDADGAELALQVLDSATSVA